MCAAKVPSANHEFQIRQENIKQSTVATSKSMNIIKLKPQYSYI